MTKRNQYRLQVLLLIAAMLALSLVLPACTTVRYVSEPLPLPERPYLPPVKAAELTCLSDETYKNLVTRETLLRQDNEDLRAIIGATHEDKARYPPE